MFQVSDDFGRNHVHSFPKEKLDGKGLKVLVIPRPVVFIHYITDAV